MSCSVIDAPFESMEEKDSSVVPVVEPLLNSQESQQSLLGNGLVEAPIANHQT
jgi:hypothetical protein